MYNCGLLIYGSNPSEYTQDIDITNKVNDKTLYYYLNQNNIEILSDAGEVILINCNSCMVKALNLSGGTIGVQLAYSYNNTITENSLNDNNYAGIYLESSENNLVEKNTINKNTYGIDMQLAYENRIKGNRINQNAYGFDVYLSDSNIFSSNVIKYNAYGMLFGVPCRENKIHHNNFIDNSVNAQDENPDTNVWDDGRKGNYWSDYNSLYPDASRIWIRGIWNIPYDIPGEENQDLYPLILPSVISRVRSIDLLDFNILKTNGFLFSFFRFLKIISTM